MDEDKLKQLIPVIRIGETFNINKVFKRFNRIMQMAENNSLK